MKEVYLNPSDGILKQTDFNAGVAEGVAELKTRKDVGTHGLCI